MKNSLISENNNIEYELANEGWIKKTIGYHRTNGTKKELGDFILFMRTRNFDDFLMTSSKIENQNILKSSINTELLSTGSITPLGNPEVNLTPSDRLYENSSNLPELANFKNYMSFIKARTKKPCILIGFDSEWQNYDFGRKILSWQFSAVWNEKLYEFCFIRNGVKDLSLNTALACILDEFEIKSYDVRKIRKFDYCREWCDGRPVITTTTDWNEACKYR